RIEDDLCGAIQPPIGDSMASRGSTNQVSHSGIVEPILRAACPPDVIEIDEFDDFMEEKAAGTAAGKVFGSGGVFISVIKVGFEFCRLRFFGNLGAPSKRSIGEDRERSLARDDRTAAAGQFAITGIIEDCSQGMPGMDLFDDLLIRMRLFNSCLCQ